ncbi:hypothetical protein GGH13_004453 [Coemansia sp. S155-1]|nr:hypothetical protein GGH13_004453 [Coemansia sp. S155-1]
MQSSNLADGSVNTEHTWLRQHCFDATEDAGQARGDASDALGILATTPMSAWQSRRQQQQQLVVGTPDSAVLDRMLELESVIATVKSSLDNHASSYYSVASQIAE